MPLPTNLPTQTNSQGLEGLGLSILLALVLDVGGVLHIYHLGQWQGQRCSAFLALLLTGIAIGWGILAMRGPSPSTHPMLLRQPTRRAIQRLLTALMLLAWILTWRDFEAFLLSADPGLPVRMAFALGGACLMGAIIFPPAPAWLIVGAAIGGTLIRLYGYSVVPLEPTRADMLPLVQKAIDRFLHGQSPYTIYAMPWELPLTYLPITWLAYVPASLLALDIRLTNVLAELAIGGVLMWRALTVSHRRGESVIRSPNDLERLCGAWYGAAGLLVWAWTFLQPSVQHWSQTTTAPIVWLLLVLLVVLVQQGYRAWGAIVLGIGMAASPVVMIVGVFVVLGWLREYGVQTTGKLVALAASIAATIILPFLLWSPQQFVLGTWQWFNDNSLFPSLKWETERTWAFMVGFSGLFWRFGWVEWLKPIQVILIAALMGVFWWRNMRIQHIATLTTAALLLFFAFNPVLWPYLYNAALVVAFVDVVGGEHGQRRRCDVKGGNIRNRTMEGAMKRTCLRIGTTMAMLVILTSLALAQSPQSSQAFSTYAPDIDALLLEHGYRRNIITMRGGARGLRASQKSYTTSIWARDLDYATSGYAFALGDMRVFRESIELFLQRVSPEGVVPEAIHSNWPPGNDYENRESWDSMPNIIHAVYVYVAKTGEKGFYQQHRDILLRVGEWIARLDTDGDGLPDRDIFPYGYYDSLVNGVMHTYAIARFYGAYQELAELEATIGQDGSLWKQRAQSMREGYHRPLEQGGYWVADQPWPIAWKKADGKVVRVLETFGVFAALRSGLIAPSDPPYAGLIRALDEYFPQLIAGPTPVRLALGGYPPETLRVVDPPVPRWMLDSSAPWIVGIAAPAYAAAGYPHHAEEMMQAYMNMARTTNPPVLEFAAGEQAAFGPGNSGDGGRTWDSAGWFLAIYGGHYGLTMTPSALIVQPHPYTCRPNDRVHHFTYQGSRIQLDLGLDCQSYRIQADAPVSAILRPIGQAKTFVLSRESAAITGLKTEGPYAELPLRLEPGRPYTVVNEGGTIPTSKAPDLPPPFAGFFGDVEFASVWARTDLPLASPPPGMNARSWLWGPQPLTDGFLETFDDRPSGTRTVQYFDKSRMEINNPDAPRDQWFVTNGLLVVEMMRGAIQVGNDHFVPHKPAEEAIAGDPIAKNPNAPTYHTFGRVVFPLEANRAPDLRGTVVTMSISSSGEVWPDPTKASYRVVIGSYNDQTGHNIPRVFMDFFAERGIVFEQGIFTMGRVMDPVFVVGLPISEPYWTRIMIGQQEHDVLVQAFERRILTYTPANEPQWRVEMGNVGQHYLRWRYGWE